MPNKKNLASFGGLGRRASRTLSDDPGASRATATLGASDMSLSGPFTVDKYQRLAFKKARTVPLYAPYVGGENDSLDAGASIDGLRDTLNLLIRSLREANILED